MTSQSADDRQGLSAPITTAASTASVRLTAAAFDSAQVRQYYSKKTADILYKYGPGPRIHFHLGMFGLGETPNTTVAQSVIQRRIIDSQEAVLDHAARSWRVGDNPPDSLLDIGCGVGGGSLYWAQNYGATVTALTVAAEHVPIVASLAKRAGVTDKVVPVLGDIHDLRPTQRFEGAVAIESTGYMDRERLFVVAAQALTPGGWFGIQEHFLCRPEWTTFVDDYYKTRLGTLTDYIRAAQAAGFELEQDDDITDRVKEFWVQSMAWTTAELDKVERATSPSPIDRQRLHDSALTHAKLFRIWRDHALETRQLLFRLSTS